MQKSIHWAFVLTITSNILTQSQTQISPLKRSRTARLFWYPPQAYKTRNELWFPSSTTTSKYPLYNDLPPTNQEVFDFIIVGSGSSGATLANRLSENPQWKVLLLEVGDVATPISDIPAMAPLFQKTALDWGYTTEKENGSCWGCPNQRMSWPKGRGLGGSTLINFMISIRGHRLDYDKWEAAGNPGWGYKDVLPYFMKLEDSSVEFQDDAYRHQGGPMPVADIPYRTESVKAFVKAAREAGYPYVDYNGKEQLGVSFVQGNIKNGLRCSSEKTYLRPIKHRKNLKILVKSRVTKILIDPQKKEATGVEFVRNRKYYKIEASKEVILSAGGLNSPQLLMLSGIGPKNHLNELGIPLIQSLPVGEKLYDHLTFLGLNYVVNESIIVTTKEFYNISNLVELVKNGRGPLTILGGVEALMYMKTQAARYEEKYPDMEAILIGSNLASDHGVAFKNTLSVSQEIYDAYWKPIQDQPFFQVFLMLVHPKSVGYMKLKSKNPFHWPKFYPSYFTDIYNDDIKTFIAAIREVNRIIKQPALQKYEATLYDKPVPGCERHQFDSDPYWECALRTISSTLHHQVGTCKMGPLDDPEAVVNNKLRVHGIGRLRVVDTSVIPMPLSAHTNIPAVMVAEKAADIIKQDWNVSTLK